MQKNAQRALLALFALALFQKIELNANPSVAIAQSPSVSITTSNLSGAAGTDLTSAVNSTSMVLGLTITGASTTFGNVTYVTAYTAYCSLGSASSNWPSNLSCNIKLLSAGSSNVTSTTNSAYVTLSSTSQSIFSGSGNGSGITLQCQLTNLSLVNCPPTTSTATLPIVITLQSS